MSLFATWLDAEMHARGFDQRSLALAVGVAESSIHNWLKQDVLPNVHQLVMISRALSIPTDTVLEQAGHIIIRSTDDGQRETRRADVLARVPRYAEIAEQLLRLSPEKQDAFLSIIEKMLPDETS